MLASRFFVGFVVLTFLGSMAAFLIDSHLSRSRKGGVFFAVNREEQNRISNNEAIVSRNLQEITMICVSDLGQCQSDLRARESECYDNDNGTDNDGAELVSVLMNIFDRSRQILFGSDTEITAIVACTSVVLSMTFVSPY